jgi:hydroxylamine reductase (hybrid-cluster protein)
MKQWKKLDDEVDVLIRQKTAIDRLIDKKMLEKDLLVMKDAFEIAINVLEDIVDNDDEQSELRLLEVKGVAKENAEKLINLYKNNAEIEKLERGY